MKDDAVEQISADRPGVPGQAAADLPRSVNGIRIPQTELARDCADYARQVMPDVLFNHAMRTFLFGSAMFQDSDVTYDPEVAFLGCLLHDLGLVERFWTPAEPFEVDSADAARRFLTGRGLNAATIDLVWDAIALHMNFAVARRKRPEIAMVCLGSALDFSGVGLEKLPAGSADAIISAYPRLGFKKDAVRTMTDICAGKPAGVVMHPFAEVGRRRVPGFHLPTPDETVLAAPFAE